MARICLIEDDPIMGESLCDRFVLEGFAVDWFTRGEPALGALGCRRYDIVISDVRLPDVAGEDVFRRLIETKEPAPPFLFISAYATVERAVAMLKLGAYDYVTKPFDIGELVRKVQAATRRQAPGPFEPPLQSADALGVSSAMRALELQAPRVAAKARTVLIIGESGTGKEVIARHLHGLAHPQGGAPFVAVNCGAIPETLMEAALFGHEKGAFSGADRARRGYFEQASGGTLFLDEIAELAPALQVKLLRALQERKVRRLGSEVDIEVDLRLYCATHRDLRGLVEAGLFREDLYYRINVVHLAIPPLRARPEDILWLAHAFLAELAAELNEPQRSLSPAAKAALLAHDWPGNVRELRNRLERACVLSSRQVLDAGDLFDGGVVSSAVEGALPTLEAFVAEAERSYLQAVLQRCHGRVAAAAAVLGISRKTLWEKTRRYGLRADDTSAN